MDIQYIGEHLLMGYSGRFALYMAFIAALFTTFAYYMASRENHSDRRLWRCRARRTFYFHTLMVAVASIFLLFILLNRYYEYRYVWVHIENDLSLGYRIAAFWAGQEGSFLFWIICQAVFGLILIRYARSWEAPVMTMVSLSQAFMMTMVIGLQFGNISIGMSPFALLRETMGEADSEFFKNPYYLSMITDGNGLNPLLRNFWMMSHPPFTFIGYASVLVPFCFAIAGLWKKKLHEWIQPALPWTVLGVFFLGIGIILGGVWAYESLTFGGFWAWDPIENASLVPWLVLIAALHLMLVSRKQKNTYFPTFLFTLLAFILVVYATYLTRSGVLADTSVHSFGNDGMGRHILIYIFTLLIISAVLLARNYRHMPAKQNEEPFTREFWLFVGALVMILSAFQVIFTTSIPVLNRIFGTNFAPPAEVVAHYNSWQLPFAVVMAVLIGMTHFIKWGKNDFKAFARSIALSFALALTAGLLITWLYGIHGIGHLLMLFSSLFALFSSLDLLLRFRKKIVPTGAIITHLGVALFLLAVLITFSKKATISENTSGFFLGQQFREDENLLLIKEEVLPMGEYHVVYVGNEYDGKRIRYQLDFLKKNKEGQFFKAFSSFPAIQINERMGNVYEPYAKVFLNRDIFTYVTFADVESDMAGKTATESDLITISVNDTIPFDNNYIILQGIYSSATDTSEINPNDIRITAQVEVLTHFGRSFPVEPVFTLKDGYAGHEDARIQDLDLLIRFKRVTDRPFTIELEVVREQPDFIIIRTVIFPYINLLWISMIVMLIGLWVAFWRRWQRREKRR